MAEESAQEKTEDPTPKRLEKALEDGQVLTSKELFVFSTLFTGFLMYFLILTFSDRILGEFKGFFSFDLSDFPGELLRMSSGAVSFILVYGVLFALPIFFVVLFTQGVLSGGINVSVKAMSFKGSRINPLEGLKRMFSTKALVELAKAVLKVSLLLGTAALVISPLYATAQHVIECQFAQRIVARRGCIYCVDGNITDWLGGDRVFRCFVAALSAYRKTEDEPARRER